MPVDPNTGLPSVIVDPAEYRQLLEKGRQRALVNMITDPECRRRMEDRFGKAKCMRRYPEAYGLNQLPDYRE